MNLTLACLQCCMLKGRFDRSPAKTPECDYYFDKGYKFAYTTFYELPKDLPG
jgi:hypothetical protein